MEKNFKRINLVLSVDSVGLLQNLSRISDKNFLVDESIDLRSLREGSFSCIQCQAHYRLKIAFKFEEPIVPSQGQQLVIKLETPKTSQTPKSAGKRGPYKKRKIEEETQEGAVRKKHEELQALPEPALHHEEVEDKTEDVELDDPENYNFEYLFQDDVIDDFESGFKEDIEYVNVDDVAEAGVEWLEEHSEEVKRDLAVRQYGSKWLMRYKKRPWWDPYFAKKLLKKDQCPVCYAKTKSPQEQQVHILSEHPFYYHHVCYICGIMKRSLRLSSKPMDDHLADHLDTKRSYVCQFCAASIQKRRSLWSHESGCEMNPRRKKRKERTPILYICDFCNKGFKQKLSVKCHIDREHNPEAIIYSCVECNFKTTYLRLFKNHSDVHVPREEWKFPCTHPGCDMRFRFKISMEKHLLTHSKERRYRCKICDKGYKQLGDLNNHMFVHTGKAYSCLFCDKKFQDRGNKNAHQRNTHPVELEEYKVNRYLPKMFR